MPHSDPQVAGYAQFLNEIVGKIRSSQYEALRLVNKELINLYWEIGKGIVEKQDQLGWGNAVVETLSRDIQAEFPGIKGFSNPNLWKMRAFYLSYKDNPILSTLSREISWSHNLIILGKCKTDAEREFYIKNTKKFGWTYNVLNHHLDTNSYHKYLTNQTNFDKTVPEKYRDQAKRAVKDDAMFNFLELEDDHTEYELEQALMKNIRKFLIEMGGDMCFVGNQYRLEVDGEEFAVDLLLYHRELKSLIAIELKTGKFKPEYAGKMQFYLAVLDDTIRKQDENPSIGIIICKDKNKTVVEYALKDSNKPIGVATYSIQKELPEKLAKYLPSGEKLAEKLGSIPFEKENIEERQ